MPIQRLNKIRQDDDCSGKVGKCVKISSDNYKKTVKGRYLTVSNKYYAQHWGKDDWNQVITNYCRVNRSIGQVAAVGNVWLYWEGIFELFIVL